MTNIEQTLNNLTPEEIAVLKTLVNKLTDTTSQPEEEQDKRLQKKRRQRRFPKGKGVKQQKNHHRGKQQNKVGQPKTKVDMYDVDDEEESPEEELSRRLSRVRKNTGARTGKGNKLCATERVRLSGENKFLTMREHKIKTGELSPTTDKLLSGNTKPTERGETRLVKAKCQYCNKKKMVSPIMLDQDEETGEIVFTCDDCLGGRRR